MRARSLSRANRRIAGGGRTGPRIVSAPVLRIRDDTPADPHQDVHFSPCG